MLEEVAVEDDTGRVPQIVAAVGWALGLASILCFGLAKPEQASMFDRMIETGRKVTEVFDPTLVRAALGLNVLAILVGLVAIVLNLGRPGGGKDQVLPGLLVVLCLGGLFALFPHIRG